LVTTGAGAFCGAGFCPMGLACAIALILLLPQFFAGFPRASWLGDNLPLQEITPSKRQYCVRNVAEIYRLGAPRFGAARPAGLPPGGTNRLDVSDAFGFGLAPAGPSDLPL